MSDPGLNPLRLVALLVGTLCILGLAKLYLYPNEDDNYYDTQLGPSSENKSAIDNYNNLDYFDNDNVVVDSPAPLSYRLPLNLVPSKYVLKIRPVIPPIQYNPFTGPWSISDENITRFTAPGQVTIEFDCVSTTNKIVMNVFNISIHEKSVKVFKGDQNETIEIIGHLYDEEQEFYTILLGEFMLPGKYQVYIKFTSYVHRGNSVAIFANSYIDPISLKTKWMTATKFQATHARKAFPCFDEPAFKAVFEITVGRTAGYHSLSNAKLKDSIKDTNVDGLYWDRFEPSLKMSVYLVCFAISDFESQDASPSLTTNGKSIKVWAPRHIINRGGGRYAANLTARIVSFFEDFFNQTDPSEKVDSIMVPLFTTSAMENWGLITYMEHMLIYLPTENTQYRRGLVTIVVAHELSHHWFGNLVTCDFWGQVWLNEGFATYLSFLAVQNLQPEFESESEFINDIVQLSQRTDPLPSTQPIQTAPKSPTEIEAAFSRTSYRKGASMIRMMQFFLGADTLKEGMRRFLTKFSFKTAVQDSLFEEFNSIGQHLLPEGITVKQIMDTWMLQAGFPLLRVSIVGPREIKLSQEAVSWQPLDQNVTPSRSWWIPITIARADNDLMMNNSKIFPHTWIPSNTSSITYAQGIDTTKWIVINPSYSAYTCVLYDAPLTFLIKQQLDKDHRVFSPVTRSQFMFDYINFWNAKYIPIESVLQMTTYLSKETAFVVWNTVFPFFNDLNRRLLAAKTHHDLLLKYLVPRVEGVLLSPDIGLEPKLMEKPIALFFRTELINLACELDSPVCLNYSMKILNKWLHRPYSNPRTIINLNFVAMRLTLAFHVIRDSPLRFPHIIPELLEEILVCAMVKAGGETAWEFIYEKYQNESSQYHQWLLFKALTCAKSEELIFRTLDLMSNDSVQNWQAKPTTSMLIGLTNNKYAIDIVFNYVLENYDSNSSFINVDVLYSTLNSLSHYLYKEEDIMTLKEFLAENHDTKELIGLSSVITTMEENLVWINIHGPVILNWLKINT